MKQRRNPARGFANDLRLAFRWLPWLIIAWLLFGHCTPPQPPAEEQEYRRWTSEELDSLYRAEALSHHPYRQEKKGE